MKVLFICKHIPYKECNGIEIKIANILRCMENVADVTSLFIVTESAGSTERFGSNVNIINSYEKAAPLRYLKHLRDIIFIDHDTKEALEKTISRVLPDVIWLEFGYVCHLIPFLKKYQIPVYYSSHNSQWKLDFDIWRANHNPVEKLKMAPFIVLYWLQERFFMLLADRFFCISTHDLAYYRKYIPANKLNLLPFFFDCSRLQNISPLVSEHPYVCLVGSLKSYQNLLAAVYALEKVWPYILSRLKDLSLYIIGELPTENSREYRLLMEARHNLDSVVFTGKVETVIPYVKGALVNIVPLTLGSGVRTKIIESAACRTPVVSTTTGAEGLPFENGRSILIADDPLQFAEHVIDLVKDEDRRRELAKQAFETYHRELSLEAGTAALSEIFAEFRKERPGKSI